MEWWWLVIALLYFLPSLEALGKRKRNAAAIVALNLLLGWTLIGWIVALVWSLTNDPPVATPAPKDEVSVGGDDAAFYLNHSNLIDLITHNPSKER
jgi:hypothetical protein